MPKTPGHAAVFALQRSAGNAAVARMLEPSPADEWAEGEAPVTRDGMAKAPAGRSCESAPSGSAAEETEEEEEGGGPQVSRAFDSHAGSDQAVVQRFKLRGFPSKERAAMEAAVPKAMQAAKATMAKKYPGAAGTWIGDSWARTIDGLRYDYVPNLGLCGWTFPFSWYVEIGKSAFDPSACCKLESTILHESRHTDLATEGQAQRAECTVFGCSC